MPRLLGGLLRGRAGVQCEPTWGGRFGAVVGVQPAGLGCEPRADAVVLDRLVSSSPSKWVAG
jgi:hypothetical protein